MTRDELILGLTTSLVGAAGMWWLWRCWTGRYRGWVTDRGFTDRFVVGLWPPVALLTFTLGITYLLPAPVDGLVGLPLLVLGMVLIPVGLVAMFLPRRWWGPRWYRRLTNEQITQMRSEPDWLTRRMNRRWEAEVAAESGRAGSPSGGRSAVAQAMGQGYSTAVSGLLGARVGEYGDDPPYVVDRTWREAAGWSGERGDGR